MINHTEIQNFKIFENLSLSFRQLNILAGKNASGKSTLIQALLLLRQSVLDRTLVMGVLRLNGKNGLDLVDIGTAQDALFRFAKTDDIIFKVDFSDSVTYQWKTTFKYKDSDTLGPKDNEDIVGSERDKMEKQALFGKAFQYLYTDRLPSNHLFLSIDVRHGRFETYDSSGNHLGEIKFSGLLHSGPNPSHNIRLTN